MLIKKLAMFVAFAAGSSIVFSGAKPESNIQEDRFLVDSWVACKEDASLEARECKKALQQYLVNYETSFAKDPLTRARSRFYATKIFKSQSDALLEFSTTLKSLAHVHNVTFWQVLDSLHTVEMPKRDYTECPDSAPQIHLKASLIVYGNPPARFILTEDQFSIHNLEISPKNVHQ